MWTPSGPKSALSGEPLKGRKKGPPTFNKGDRVWVTEPPSMKRDNEPRNPSWLGIIENGPKTSLGSNYYVRFEGGYVLHGRDCPQSLTEDWLAPAEEPAPIPGGVGRCWPDNWGGRGTKAEVFEPYVPYDPSTAPPKKPKAAKGAKKKKPVSNDEQMLFFVKAAKAGGK